MRVKPRINYTEEREMFDRPDGMIDCAEEIDGVLRSWKEFIPSGYDGTKAVPLVVTLHGGSSKRGGNNHRAELSTAWAAVAEREGFIVLYPQSMTPEHGWSAWEDFSSCSERNKGLKDDIRYLDLLLDLILQKYRLDEERIYLHGQSFGDVMGSYYLVNRKNHRFAAAAPLSGPAGASRYFNPDGSFRYGTDCALPIVRTHGSEDLAIPMGEFQHLEDEIPTFDLKKEIGPAGIRDDIEALRRAKMEYHQLVNLELWKNCNACLAEPLLSVRGRYNAVTYPGIYDFHFYIVEQGGHGPSMDMADFIWSFFFSGYRKRDGRIDKTEPECSFSPDQNAVVLAANASKAYVNNRPVLLNGKIQLRDGVFYLPHNCISEIYPGLSVTLEDEAAGAVLREGSRWMQVSASNKTIVWCNHLKHRERTLLDGDTLLIPARQIGELFYGQTAKCGYDVIYLSEGDGVISYDFAYLVRQLLGTERILSVKEMWEREQKLLNRVKQPGLN